MSKVFIPISSQLMNRILRFLEETKAVEPVDETIEMFIEYGLRTAEQRLGGYSDKSPLPDLPVQGAGYLWRRSGKSLFLPEGTRILRRYRKQDHFAKVERGAFRFGDAHHTTPAELARALSGNTSVNAWSVLWIQRPGDLTWRQAMDLAEAEAKRSA